MDIKLKYFQQIFRKLLAIWIVFEIAFQLYFDFFVMSPFNHQWERYSFSRNLNTLLEIEEILIKGQESRIYYEYPEELPRMNSISPQLMSLLIKLRNDLALGICHSSRSTFSFIYWRDTSGIYRLEIETGPKFRSDFKGYNLSVVVTNGDKPAIENAEYEDLYRGRFFVEKQINRQYKKSGLVSKYNNEMYNLLVFRLMKLISDLV